MINVALRLHFITEKIKRGLKLKLFQRLFRPILQFLEYKGKQFYFAPSSQGAFEVCLRAKT